MKIRSLLLAIIIIFNSSLVLGQESLESKANRILTKIYSMPNLPNLEPVKIRIDEVKKYGSEAYYLRNPKRFFGLKTSKTSEIHLYRRYVIYCTDNALLVTLAHELGHHFDTKIHLYFKPRTPLESLIKMYGRTGQDQYFAEAFAIHVLGEDLYKKGRQDHDSVSMFKYVYSLYADTNPILYKYREDKMELWVNYWLSGAKSRLDEVEKLIQDQTTP